MCTPCWTWCVPGQRAGLPTRLDARAANAHRLGRWLGWLHDDQRVLRLSSHDDQRVLRLSSLGVAGGGRGFSKLVAVGAEPLSLACARQQTL